MSQSLALDRAEIRRRADRTERTAVAEPRPRVASIDLLRGLVMILMALDHTRAFFEPAGMNVRDVSDASLFMTRWITHICAPVFILLAGTAAFLHGARGRSRRELALFLLTRGLWLILIEFSLLRLAWSFDPDWTFLVAQVIWAIGASMIVLAGLVFLPRAVVVIVAIALIGGHNLLDGVKAAELGAAAPLWSILHQRGLVSAGGVSLYILYPLVPWVGVMAAGYALGPLFRAERARRRRWLVRLGLACMAAFVILRATNLYGDPVPWRPQASLLATVLAFIDCEKYPPSLLYLLMTLGPGLILLATFEDVRGRIVEFVITFGRVPFFYYVAHIFLIHALAVLFAWATIGDASFLMGGPGRKPPSYGLSLPAVYAVTALVVVLLYPACRSFAALKARRTSWWLSYL